MIKINWDEGFKRIYKKKIKNDNALKQKFWKTIKLFSQNPYQPQLRTHKLSGKLSDLHAFCVAYDCRVVFKFINDNEVLLIDIGGHDEVY